MQNRNQNRNWRSNSSSEQHNSASRNHNNNRRPYLGKCQACCQQGHNAKLCPLFHLVQQQQQQTQSAQSTPAFRPRGTQNGSRSAYNVSTMPPDPSSWLLDSGATHHITSDRANLALHSPYNGSEEVMVGNGIGLQITHTGSLSLPHSTHALSLQNVLTVPSIARNLISVKRLCTNNLVSVEFFPNSFHVKDLNSGAQLIQGKTSRGGYEWPAPNDSRFCVFSATIKSPLPIWHSRLGHLSVSVLKSVVSHYSLPTLNKDSSLLCNACSISKSHKIPFSTSTLTSYKPLELLFSDVWTSPVHSIDGYKYYVIFVDHFTHYVWLYPLRKK